MPTLTYEQKLRRQEDAYRRKIVREQNRSAEKARKAEEKRQAKELKKVEQEKSKKQRAKTVRRKKSAGKTHRMFRKAWRKLI